MCSPDHLAQAGNLFQLHKPGALCSPDHLAQAGNLFQLHKPGALCSPDHLALIPNLPQLHKGQTFRSLAPAVGLNPRLQSIFPVHP